MPSSMIDPLAISEKIRLAGLGITAMHVLIIDGIPVAQVAPDVLKVVADRRNNGDVFDGVFVSEENGKWRVSTIRDGRHFEQPYLTQMMAYRLAVGERVGHERDRTRFKSSI